MTGVDMAYEELVRKKKLTLVQPEDTGWLVEFECKHLVWCAVKPVETTMYCAVCAMEFLKLLRAKQAVGLERLYIPEAPAGSR